MQRRTRRGSPPRRRRAGHRPARCLRRGIRSAAVRRAHAGMARQAPPGAAGRALGVPFRLENDVNLAALAEQRSGAARGCADFVYCWAGEGIGSAIMLEGRLRRGATGGAGEIGFMPVPGASLVRRVTRANAGGFHELAGREAICGWPVSAAWSAPPPRRSWPPPQPTGSDGGPAGRAGDPLRDGPRLRGQRARPARSWCWPAPSCAPGGTTAGPGRARAQRAGHGQPGTGGQHLDGNPVLSGAQYAALDLVRDDVFSSG